MSLEHIEKEYLKYLQQKHKEGRKSRAKKEGPEVGLLPTAAAAAAAAAAAVSHPPSSVDSEPEVIAQAVTKRGRKPKQATAV